jgi:WD40 repeat protein
MERKPCNLCGTKENSVVFSCKHLICRLCINKVVVFNQLEIFKDIKRQETISLICTMCSKGTHNSTKQKLLDFKTQTSGLTKCEIHPDSSANFFCRTCAKLLCYTCLSEHVNTYPKHKVTNNLSQIFNLCKIHTSESEKYRCLTCGIDVCNTCGKLNHGEGHRVILINDQKAEGDMTGMNQEIADYIDGLIVPIRQGLINDKLEVIDKCNDLVEMVNDMKSSYETEYTSLEEDIKVAHSLIKTSYLQYYKGTNEEETMNHFNKDFFFYEKLSQCGKIAESLNKAKFELMNQKTELLGKDLSEISFEIKKLNLKIKETLRGHTQSVWTICQLRNGKIASGSGDKTIRLWDPEHNYECVKVLTGHSGAILKLQELYDGELASCSKDATVRIWDSLQEYNCIRILEGHTDAIWTITQLAGEMFATGSHDNTIRIWNSEFKCQKVLLGHESYVNSVVQLEDGRLVSGSNDNTIRVWNHNYECIKVLTDHSSYVNCLIKLAENRIASGSEDQTIIIYDVLADFKVLKLLQGHANSVNSLHELDDGRLVSGSYDNTIMIWDPNLDYKCVKVLEGHTNYVNSIYQLKDGSLVSASADNTIRLWG